MIDTHAHLNLENFKNDYREVAQRSFSFGVRKIINVGVNFQTSKRAIEIAKEIENCYAAVGLHPEESLKEKFLPNKYNQLLKESKKIVAVGEIGLDYYRLIEPEKKAIERENFINQLNFAQKNNLPIIIHSRGSKTNPKDSYLEIIEIIKNNYRSRKRGVIHCFTSDWEIAQKFLNLNFYIGFTGIITFKNVNRELIEVVKKIPLDKLLIETDCPFLAPETFRGKRCEPWHVKFTLKKIAEIKNLSFDKAEKITSENTKELFKLK
ncbi:TatD family hydrolase [bacterium]|nr:TatD family hydrolase [bacterium]